MNRATCLVTWIGLVAAGLAAEQDQQKDRDRDRPPGAEIGQLQDARWLELYDRNKDGFLDPTEVPPRLRSRLAQLDVDKDGKLSREELAKGVAFLQPERRPADVLAVLIDLSHCDEGCVSELQHIYAKLRKLDRNNDGRLAADELEAARQDLIQERVTHALEEWDRNDDARISRDEARGQLQKDFDRFDTDRNGFITREELQRAFAATGVPPGAEKKGRP